MVGLYAAIPALLLYPVFGSSRHLVVGPMSATAALSAGVAGGIVSATGDDFTAYTAGLAIAVGVMAVVAGLLRLGFLANFISEPVLKGFIVGMALVIIVGQLPKVFGIDGGEGNFFERLWAVVTSMGDAHGWTILVAAVCLAVVLVMKVVAPRVPGSLVAVVLGILLVTILDLDAKGVATVGEIDAGLPSFAAPDVAAADLSLLISGGAGVMLVGFAGGLGAAKTYAQRNGYRIDPNRELLGLGSANLGAGFFSGMVVNGSLSKTAVNGGAGARSQVSGDVVAGLTVLTLLFLTPLFANLPEPALAAVVIAAVIELVDFGALRRLYRVSTTRLAAIYGHAARADFIAAVGAMLGVLIFDTLPGLVIGVVLSVLLLLYRISKPHVAVLGEVPGGADQWADVDRHPENRPVPGVVVVRVESPMIFANADTVQERLRELAEFDGVRALVLDAAAVPAIDVTAAQMMRDLAEALRGRGVAFVAVGNLGQVRDVLRESGAAEVLTTVYPTIDAAVAAVTRRPETPDHAAPDR
ncbi:high affinity sulphate transporter 1 [Jiangella alkaliphila]|uniref:High affinity sulphate transporter 1 n=1 Tax=Jiangella alkaliphila TaxID=419479 RepID=A0A1H2LD02_9ACTN|nr:SulP family inorganic anion transporter [Jiangella alkaliphila]SDU78809.1 high affinity sulphate transporter 1 [Jiangella alkaliphila]